MVLLPPEARQQSQQILYSLFQLSLVTHNLSAIVDGGGIPTTLDGPFKPVTVPLDQSFRAVDLPDTDPLVQRTVQGFQPEQISLSLSASHDSVWISWITGEFQIGDNIEPLDPETVASIVQYGRLGRSMRHNATGYSIVYSQLYPFEGLQNYTSGIIHHVRLTGLRPNTLYQYQCGDPSLSAMSDVHYFRTMPVSGPKSYPKRDQYRWLERDLASVDREVTPWLIATWHAPWCSTYGAHYREAECMRVEMEDLLYKYGIDIVFNGHVHAYERSNRVYNYTLNPCGPVYITVGDGGNREKMAITHADEPGQCPEPSTTPDDYMGGLIRNPPIKR
ncbi:hypothetical protein AAZX31_11G260400 [Glycine max]|nr:Purple acid phosphatase 15 [Glycine max]